MVARAKQVQKKGQQWHLTRVLCHFVILESARAHKKKSCGARADTYYDRIISKYGLLSRSVHASNGNGVVEEGCLQHSAKIEEERWF